MDKYAEVDAYEKSYQKRLLFSIKLNSILSSTAVILCLLQKEKCLTVMIKSLNEYNN